MKKPSSKGTAIDLRRYERWREEFAGFRRQVPEGRIRDWIGQFAVKDHDTAARVLDCVEFISHEQITAAFRAILPSLSGWDREPSKREGKWRFVPYSSSAGESGDSMLHKFRHANNLTGRIFNELFIYRSDIIRQRLDFEDTVVLIDDFVGTGGQACTSWDKHYEELLVDVGTIYLVVVAACSAAIKKVADNTELKVVPHIQLTESDNVFSPKCKQFETNEKETILKYCETADSDKPRGHGECGLLVVFGHSAPNNTIPMLHKRSRGWEGLFPRYD